MRISDWSSDVCSSDLGVKRGYVADMEKTELAIRQAVDQAERNAQINADSAFVSFSAGGLDSDIPSVDVDIAGHRIAQADIYLVLSEGKRSLDIDLAQCRARVCKYV